MKKFGIMLMLLLSGAILPAFAAEQEEAMDAASAPMDDMEMNTALENMDEENMMVPETVDAASEVVNEVKEEVAAVAQPKVAMQGKAQAVNYGDFRSSTLTTKAWNALASNDIESVLAYTNKCIELYAEAARKMQKELKDYPTGSNDDIFKLWALNDVATSYYIQAEAYRNANMKDEAKEAYNKVVNDYTYGQAWDTKGWFWKPAEAAKEKLEMIDSGKEYDFGDYSSSSLVQKAWAALEAKDIAAVETYANKAISLYGAKAKEMQDSLKEYAWESKEKTMSYWALNDVGTALFILGEAYRNAGKIDKAKEAYQKLIDEYFYSQCWDPQGWFWKPAEAAQQKIGELDNA